MGDNDEKLAAIMAELSSTPDDDHLEILQRHGLDVEAGRRLSQRVDDRIASETQATRSKRDKPH